MSDPEIKSDAEENSQDDSAGPPSFAAALGLQRVGAKAPPKPVPSQPIQVLNARGMPARIRKKNKLFFDDDMIVNDKPQRISPTKRTPGSQKTTPVKLLRSASKTASSAKKRKLNSPQNKFAFRIRDLGVKATKGGAKRKRDDLEESDALDLNEEEDDDDEENEEDDDDEYEEEEELPMIDKKTAQKIGYKLRNLLKLPKAHKFVSYEWFYSSIDQPLFDGETDFQVCLRESFPQLKTNMLTRVEWNKIRNMMGKPRRCSQAFFEEERIELERKRQKIRILQTRKYCDVSFVKHLPKEIPSALNIGMKVTARIRRPQDGLFTGVVDAVESNTNSYRIKFDRVGLGPQSIPDFEILANEPLDTIFVHTLTQRFRPRGPTPLYIASSLKKPGVPLSLTKDPFLIASSFNNIKPKAPKDHIGGFPLKLLELIVRARKTLQSKNAKLLRLKEMNNEAEMYKSYGEDFPDDFQRKYASIIIGMEKLNRDLQDYLNQIQTHCKDIVRDTQQTAILTPSYLREKCRQMGEESFNKNNTNIIKDNRLKSLISNLGMLLWVISNVSNNDDNTQVLHSIEACIEDVKNKLDKANIETFQKHVQIHLHHIQLELRQSITNNIDNSSNNNKSNNNNNNSNNNNTIEIEV